MRLYHPPTRHEDRALLIDAVRDAGALALRHFRAGVRSWEKSKGDPVSEADLEVDALLRERLGGERPGYGWLSEETEDNADRLTRSRVWIVDPIDGTRAFIKSRPEFTVCAALTEDGAPVLGAVFNPATDEFFFAEAGKGATLNDAPIAVPGAGTLAGARLLASRRTFESHQWLKQTPDARFESINSIAYRMVLVAAGRFDATLSLAAKCDWDIAAADLVVREAGGVCTTANGEAFRYNEPSARHPDLIAAPPALHAELLALVRRR